MGIRCQRGCWSVMCFTLMLAGCAGEPAPSGQQPVATAPSAAKGDLKPKAAEMPKLPDGAGAIAEDAPKELTPTSTGLYYRVLRQGDGKKPAASNTVLAHYEGWLDDGTVFDSSYKRGAPIDFPLNGVIPGWTEGLQLIGEGGMIELEIPGELGYGAGGSPPKIGPNATLHFLVELKEVK